MDRVRAFVSDFNNTYSIDEKIALYAFTSLFLPWFVSLGITFVLGMYVLFTRDVKKLVVESKGGVILFLFAIYSMLVSFLNMNWYGLATSFFMALMFVLVLHFRAHVHKKMFHAIIEIVIGISIVAVIYGIFEQFYYMSQFSGMGFFDIQNKPQYRVHTFFFNANYYALVILFVECMCIYKFFIRERIARRTYYICVGLLNIFAMYLTGGRIAWLALAVGVTTMVLVNRWWKTLLAAIGIELGAALLIKWNPKLIPRLAMKRLNIERRRQIWQAAVLMVKEYGFFGAGPLTYYMFYPSYEDLYIETYGLKSFMEYESGIAAPHAHTMFLELFLSFGVIGTLLLFEYFFVEIHMIIQLITKKIDGSLASFLCGCLMMALCYCIIDFPLLWPQTGYLLLLILGCSEVYREELKEC